MALFAGQGHQLVAVDSPEAFLSDTPTAVLVRQVLGAVSQFEKASLVAKLAAARKRQRRQPGKCEGRKGYRETHPALVERARVLRRGGRTLAQVAAALASQGMVAGTGRPFAPAQIARLLTAEDNRIGRQHRAVAHHQPAPTEVAAPAPMPHNAYRPPGRP